MIILPYLKFSSLRSSPNPQPKAVIKVVISEEDNILWSCALEYSIFFL